MTLSKKTFFMIPWSGVIYWQKINHNTPSSWTSLCRMSLRPYYAHLPHFKLDMIWLFEMSNKSFDHRERRSGVTGSRCRSSRCQCFIHFFFVSDTPDRLESVCLFENSQPSKIFSKYLSGSAPQVKYCLFSSPVANIALGLFFARWWREKFVTMTPESML